MHAPRYACRTRIPAFPSASEGRRLPTRAQRPVAPRCCDARTRAPAPSRARADGALQGDSTLAGISHIVVDEVPGHPTPPASATTASPVASRCAAAPCGSSGSSGARARPQHGLLAHHSARHAAEPTRPQGARSALAAEPSRAEPSRAEPSRADSEPIHGPIARCSAGCSRRRPTDGALRCGAHRCCSCRRR